MTKPVRVVTLDLNDDQVIAVVVATLDEYEVGHRKVKIANSILADLRRYAENAGVAAVIAQDHMEWPLGHPCRDCGQLFDQHPVQGCAGWR